MIATSASNPPPPRSANADWMRALQRTAAITPASTRTLPTALDVNAAAHPARPALLGETASLTYAELASLSHRYAHWALRQGLRKGDRVALLMDNGPDYVAIWLGLARVGVVTALLNTQLAGSGLAHCLALAEPRRIIVATRSWTCPTRRRIAAGPRCRCAIPRCSSIRRERQVCRRQRTSATTGS